VNAVHQNARLRVRSQHRKECFQSSLVDIEQHQRSSNPLKTEAMSPSQRHKQWQAVTLRWHTFISRNETDRKQQQYKQRNGGWEEEAQARTSNRQPHKSTA
jgi:hypothetical protein